MVMCSKYAMFNFYPDRHMLVCIFEQHKHRKLHDSTHMYMYIQQVFPIPQDITVAGVENDISQTLLQISYVTSRLKWLQQTLDEQKESLQKQNELISQTDVEITRNNALIERKQTPIDQMNKKITQKLSKMEGVSVTTLHEFNFKEHTTTHNSQLLTYLLKNNNFAWTTSLY